MTIPKTPPAWEPLTPRGVAAFAHAKIGRLLTVQFIVALFVVAAVVWVLLDGLFPIVTKAIEHLPTTGEIRSARLDWRGEPAQSLAEGKVIAFNVDLDHGQTLRSAADVQVEFGRDTVRFISWLGYLDFHYPSGWVITLNRTDLIPKWGAWRLPLLVIAAAGVVVYLITSWAVLATVYSLPVLMIGFFANRNLNFCASWRISGAALMPGALLLAVAIVLYGFGLFDLVQMAFVFGGHLVLGWVYLGVGLMFLPRQETTVEEKKNPFAPPSA